MNTTAEGSSFTRRVLIFGAFLLLTTPLLVLFGRRVHDEEAARLRTEEGYKVFIKYFDPRPKAPGFVLKNLKAEKESLSDYAGKVVFLNFRTTW